MKEQEVSDQNRLEENVLKEANVLDSGADTTHTEVDQQVGGSQNSDVDNKEIDEGIVWKFKEFNFVDSEDQSDQGMVKSICGQGFLHSFFRLMNLERCFALNEARIAFCLFPEQHSNSAYQNSSHVIICKFTRLNSVLKTACRTASRNT